MRLGATCVAALEIGIPQHGGLVTGSRQHLAAMFMRARSGAIYKGQWRDNVSQQQICTASAL